MSHPTFGLMTPILDDIKENMLCQIFLDVDNFYPERENALQLRGLQNKLSRHVPEPRLAMSELITT